MIALRSSREHLAALARPLAQLEEDVDRLDAWGQSLARVLLGGGRLLCCGNGGSAAQAQHLSGELVGRYAAERVPLAAIALHQDGASLTAIANDYGPHEGFARQVRAYGRPGDVLIALSTSGCSRNVVAAAEVARASGLTAWALTGPAPNPLADACDDAFCVDADSTATIQEVHQIALHLLCGALDAAIAERPA